MNDKVKKVKTGICKHCGEPIRIAKDGCWVHDDPDEDPNAFDYGWVKCSATESGWFEEAEPIEG
jgi:hypothetical protein